jgi:predicted nucleic acid-binding protein
MKELLLDANVLVRFLTRDDPKQGPAATALFEQAERCEVTLHWDGLVVAEVVYVLIGRYERSRAEVVDTLLAVIQNAGVETLEAGIVTDALHRFGALNVEFADAWLAARSAHGGRAVVSFDRDFDKFKDVKWVEPTS